MSDLPQTATGVLQMFSTSLTGINIMSDQLIRAVHDGEINPLNLRIQIKAIEMVLERVKKETANNAMTEAGKYTEKNFNYMGVDFQKAEHGTKYDYAGCGDSVYSELSEVAEKANEAVRSRAEFLKALKEPLRIVNDDTGEVMFIKPPVKTSVSGLNISIK